METTIELPESIEIALNIGKKEIKRYLKETIAAELYLEGKISLEKAKEIVGARNRWEMLIILSERGIEIDYDAVDLKRSGYT